jgi:ADP-dependent NAD(P)H-hydrate dehydratase
MLRLPHADATAPVDLDDALSTWPLPLDESGDKTTRGTVLVIAGATGTPGAALLGGIAALRMGAGRLQIATAEPVAISLAIAVPEALVMPLPVDADGDPTELITEPVRSRLPDVQAVLLGPGLRAGPTLTAALADIAEHTDPAASVVVDAGALPSLAQSDAATLRRLRGRMVLTPNRAELAALTDHDPPDLQDAALRWQAVVTSFGEVVAPDGRAWHSDAREPGLGTSGSGDVLAGLVAGAAARCGDVAQAACWATAVHMHSASRLAARIGRVGFIARELLEEAPAALLALSGGAGIGGLGHH